MNCVATMVESKPANTTAAAAADADANSTTQNGNNKANNNQRRSRRVSSSALYEVWRKDLNDVCYLYVPDEYDLVKSHLMFAVREEVEVLKEKISELMERITQLEYENTILKANATQDTLAQIQAKANQLHSTGGSSSVSNNNS